MFITLASCIFIHWYGNLVSVDLWWKYFDKSFTEMFTNWSATKHIHFGQTSWLVVMATIRENFRNILKNQLLRSYMGDKAELCRNVHSISLYKNIVFIAVAHVLWLLWQLKVSIDFQQEKWKLALIAGTLQVFWQNVFRNICWVILHQA